MADSRSLNRYNRVCAITLEAADVRLGPIVMTGITTAAGSVPLLLSSGPGTETRIVIGTLILYGVRATAAFTL